MKFYYFIISVFSICLIYGQQTEVLDTAGNGTFIVPDGVSEITVEVWGAGGGGSVANTASGGGGGGYARSILEVSAGDQFSYVVGSKGTQGVDGQNSSFNSTIIGGGGKSGSGSTGGLGGIGSGGNDANYNGGNGGNSEVGQGKPRGGGGGGGSATANANGSDGNNNAGNSGGSGGAGEGFGGNGGNGNNGNGFDGSFPGGGGGGAAGPGGGGTSGSGADGLIIITYKASYIQIISGNWNTASNWNLGSVPTPSHDAIIASGITSVITQNQEIKDLIVNSESIVEINDDSSLILTGDITNNGEFTSPGTNRSGEILLSGATTQNLLGNGFYENIRLDNINGANIQDTITIKGILNINQGNLITNNALTFFCDFSTSENKVGQVGQINGNIIGEVTVEQCFPKRRAFRFISSSTTTSTSIQDNWQEGATSYNDIPVDAVNSPPIFYGYGTHITGNNTSETDNSQNNGFDWSPSGNPSLFTFDNINQQWNSISNTASNNLIAGEPYRLLIRGDRSINITNNSANSNNTKLRSKGQLTNNSKTFTNLNPNEGFASLIGNPYQSVVDMSSVINNSTNIQQYFIVWDPTLGGKSQPGQSGGRGAYVTVDAFNNSTNINNTDMNKYLQPYQAVFVLTGSENTAPELVFDETDKAVDQTQLEVFSSNTNSHNIMMSLYDSISYTNNDTPDDGLNLNFSINGNNDINNMDALKFGNLDENLAVWSNNTSLLSIENRKIPQKAEVLQLYTTQYRSSDYVLELEVGSFPDNNIYLVDHYNTTNVLLSENATNTYSYSVDSTIAESVAWNRFTLEFETETLGVRDNEIQNSVLVYPNPTSDILNINLNQNLDTLSKIEIYDLNGKLVIKNEPKTKSLKLTQLDVSSLSRGIYLLKVTSDNQVYNKKIIVE